MVCYLEGQCGQNQSISQGQIEYVDVSGGLHLSVPGERERKRDREKDV